jgi:CheY-like chemotaxis protein
VRLKAFFGGLTLAGIKRLAEIAEHAVAVYLTHRNEVAAVLADMMMPIMDGPATIHTPNRASPEIKSLP